MADRPIIFSGPMVRALLAGRKTQTRRLATSPLANVEVGDRLWARESWWVATRYSYGTTPGGSDLPPPPLAQRGGDPVHYAADGDPPNCVNRHHGPEGLRGGWFAAPDPYAVWHRKPSIHMPRWASRLTLVVEALRFERLQEISAADAEAEGTERGSMSWIGAYHALWDSLHNCEGERWADDPAVVALTFRVERGNIDRIAA